MADQGVQLDQDQFCCSVCLDLLKEPVTINCGHSYCSGCINACWDQDDQRGVHSCPQCRQTFTPRPILRRNNLLAEVVDKLKDTGLQAAPSAKCYAGPEDVACDLCIGKKQKACKSCLVCLASYCQSHLQPHYDAAPLKKHKLVKASRQLQEKLCPHHDEAMKMFCRTDEQCICYLCSVGEHKGHDVVSAAAERKAKQTHLIRDLQPEVWQRAQEREEEVKDLQQAVGSLNLSAQAALKNSEGIFTELICSLLRRRCEVKELITDQQRAAVSWAEGLVAQLEEERAELKRRDDEMEQLSHTDDDIRFLQSYASLASLSEPPDVPNLNGQAFRYFEDVSGVVSELSKKLQNLLDGEWSKMSATVRLVDALAPPGAKPREDLLQYACRITLDINTAHRYLSLSEGNRKVTLTQQQRHPDRQERFVWSRQVLSREGLSGQSYWEAEWHGVGAQIAVSYKSIERSGHYTRFGQNDKSWCLRCYRDGYLFIHNNVIAEVPGPLFKRIGVHLDYSAGTLSFYGVSNTVTLLHRVQTKFTQPLYPGVGLGLGNWRWGDSVKL